MARWLRRRRKRLLSGVGRDEHAKSEPKAAQGCRSPQEVDGCEGKETWGRNQQPESSVDACRTWVRTTASGSARFSRICCHREAKAAQGGRSPRRFASPERQNFTETLPKLTIFPYAPFAVGGWGRAAGRGAGFRSAKTATGDGKRQRAGAIQSAPPPREGVGVVRRTLCSGWPHRFRVWVRAQKGLENS